MPLSPRAATLMSALIVCATMTARAQIRPALAAADVMGATPQLAARSASATSRELTVRWTIEVPAGTPPARDALADGTHTFQLMSSAAFAAPAVRERDPQLSTDRLLIMAVGPAGDLGWQLVADPRVLRAETPGLDGALTGQTLYRSGSDFLVSLPADLNITQLRIYQIDWNGAAFVLRLMGTVDVPRP